MKFFFDKIEFNEVIVKEQHKKALMPAALTSKSPGVARRKRQSKNNHPGGVTFKLQ
jgi:hypothetical protein